MTPAHPPGRVGPNAITRILEALQARGEPDAAERIFTDAGLTAYLTTPPTAMVDEAEVMALHQALRGRLGMAQARQVAWDAGERTGDYLLAKRIPRPAQWILKLLPPSLASGVLLKAIRGNAWTFVGTGAFAVDAGYPPRLRITNSLLCRGVTADQPVCDFYAGTYERLFRVLVHPHTQVKEVACHAKGDPECVFEVRWS